MSNQEADMISRKASEMDEVHTTFGLSAAGQRCWACRDLLSDPAVMWSFSHRDGLQMYLCPACAKSVAMGMIRDAVDITHAQSMGRSV